MNRKTVKIIISILAILLLVSFVATSVYAANGTQVTPKAMNDKIDYGTEADNADLLSMAGKVMGFIRNISVIGGVILLMILGVKYMLGSTEEKADYKKSLIPLVVGILIVMAATSIMTFIIGMFD